MKRQDISSFALKIMGILCIIFAITSLENLLAYVIYTISESGNKQIEFAHLVLYASLPFTILLVSGILLIYNSSSWGEKFWTGKAEETHLSGLSKDDVQIIGFSLIGILLLAFSVPKLFKIIVSIAEAVSVTEHSPYMSYFFKDIIFVLVQIAIGLYLFIGSVGFNKIWRLIQKTRD